MDAATALWTVTPLAVVHAAAWRRRPLLWFQLLVDIGLLLLPGRILLRGLHLGPGVPDGQRWHLAVTAVGSPEQSDLPLQFEVWWEEVRRLAAAGSPPWISDRLGAGTPLYSHGQTELPFPLQAPVWVLGAERGTDVMAVWKLELAALAAFALLCRLRVVPAAAAAGALAFAFGMSQLSWLVVPLAWVVAASPLAWWALIGALRGMRRSAALLAALLGVLAGWSVHAETAAFLWLAVAVGGVVLAWGRWRRVRRLVLPLLLGTAIAGVGAVPALVDIAGSSKLAALEAAPPYPMPWVSWPLRARLGALLISPWRDGHPADGSWAHPFPCAAVSLGVGGIVVALALAAGPRRRLRRVALALAVVGVLAAALVYQLPGVAHLGARLPVLRDMTWARAGFLVAFVLAVLGALGADATLRRRSHRRVVACGLAVALAVALLGVTAVPAARGRATRAAAWPALAALGSPTLAGAVGWSVAGLVLAEACVQGWDLLPGSVASEPAGSAPLSVAVRESVAREGGRFLALAGGLPANLGARVGLEDLRDHDPVRPTSLASLHRAVGAKGADLPCEVTTPWVGIAGAWGVRWLETPAAGLTGATGAGWQEVVRSEDWGLYRNPRALPVLRLASRAVTTPGDPARGEWESVDFATTAVVETPLVLGGAGTVAVLADRPSYHAAEVDVTGPVLALLHVPYAPGWSASLDRQRAPIVMANLGAMGILVPGGHHVVAWRYAPVGLGTGIALTLAGLAGCLALALISRRTKR